LGYIVDAAQITKHLRRRHPIFALATGLLAIEHPVPALGLDDGGAMLEALPRVERRGLRLRISLREQQGIRYVVARRDRKLLLDRHIGPADRFEQRPDEFLFRLGFVRIFQLEQACEETGEPNPRRLYYCGIELDP